MSFLFRNVLDTPKPPPDSRPVLADCLPWWFRRWKSLGANWKPVQKSSAHENEEMRLNPPTALEDVRIGQASSGFFQWGFLAQITSISRFLSLCFEIFPVIERQFDVDFRHE